MRTVIVCGPPCSGKNTYVNGHIQQGDILIDNDRIKEAFFPGYMRKYDDAQANRLANNIKSIAIQEAANLLMTGRTMWIVTCTQNPSFYKELIEKLDAEIVRIDKDKQECIQNLLKDDSREDKLDQMQVIDRYFRDNGR